MTTDKEKTTQLYLVPTPIGNLDDITLRAIKVLKEVNFILAEDTRNTIFLLKHLEIEKQVLSHHAFNEHKTIENVIHKLKEGQKIALVSDAGTPGISDPGFLLARAALNEGIKIECLPGATAFVPALLKSGLPADRFIFEGFLPVKKGRNTLLTKLQTEERTIILYESPHRIIKTLLQLQEFMGEDRIASLSREITKKFEETVNGTLKEIHDYFNNEGIPKGEIVLVIEGAPVIKTKKNKYQKEEEEDE